MTIPAESVGIDEGGNGMVRIDAVAGKEELVSERVRIYELIVKRVNFQGQCYPGSEVSVFVDGKRVRTQCGADGRWAVVLDRALLDPDKQIHEAFVQGKTGEAVSEQVKIGDIVFGEVKRTQTNIRRNGNSFTIGGTGR